MALLGPELYGDERTFYGALPWSALSANPMRATVLAPGIVSVTWAYPTVPGIQAFRVVRNQSGDPAYENDGTVVFQQNALQEGQSSSGVLDSVGIIPGRYAFYAAFVKIAGGWRRVGRTSVVVPGRVLDANMGTVQDPVYFNPEDLGEAMLGLLPPVFTSPQHNSVGTPSSTSQLARLLSALSLTAEEVRTVSDLLLPSYSKDSLPPGLLGPAFQQLGMEPERGLPIRDQKRLLREASTLRQSRGTGPGLTRYVEALTGWAPTLSMSSNALRHDDDAVFAHSVGEWRAVPISGSTPSIAAVSCETFQPPTDPDWPITTTASVLGTQGRLELPAYGWDLEDDHPSQLFQVKPNTTYTVSGWFRGGTGATTSYAKSVNMYARGWRNKGKVHERTWPSTLIYDPLSGEWKIDEPGFFPRESSATFVLPSGTNNWVRESVTFNTGPNVRFVSFALVWTCASGASEWAFTGFQLEEGDEAGVVTLPKTAVVTVSPSRTNLVKNPTFHSGSTSGWTLASCTGTPSAATPPDAMTSSSLSLTAAGAWGFHSSTSTLKMSADGSVVASAYLGGGGPSGYTVNLTLEAVGATTVSNTVSVSTAPTPRLVNSMVVDAGTLRVATREPHRLAVGQPVSMNAPVAGTRTVTRILSETVFEQTLADDDRSYGPTECATTTVTPTAGEWVRPEVCLNLPAGDWAFLRLRLVGPTAVSGLLVSASAVEAGSIKAGDYFDGDSPGQYGVEWRGTAHASETDMYPGLPLKSVRLKDTLRDYVPRLVGARVVTLGGTVIASLPADA